MALFKINLILFGFFIYASNSLAEGWNIFGNPRTLSAVGGRLSICDLTPGASNCFRNPKESNASPGSEIITKSDIHNLISRENDIILALTTLKSRILKANTDYSISKTVGSSVSTAGTVATIAGFVLAPVTAGASLTLSVGGLTATILGAGTSLTTSIIEMVKTNEWANELETSLDSWGKELQEIGEKIVTHPDWIDYTMLGGSGGLSILLKTPALTSLGNVLKYLLITGPQYGIEKWPAFALSVQNLPGVGPAWWLHKNAQELPKYFFKNSKFPALSQWLNKAVTKLNTSVLSKVGVNLSKIGASTLAKLSVALGVAGIALDTYTIVDTWTSHPELATQIDQVLECLRDSRDKLNILKSELSQ